MNDLWRTFHLIPDIKNLNDAEQIQYWKYSYHKAMGMFEDCAENYIEQLDFHRSIIKDLRMKLQEAQRANHQ